MDLYGYDRGESGDQDGTLRELREVSVVADDPAELRRVAQFFAEAASIVESRRDLDPETYGGLAARRTLIDNIGGQVGEVQHATTLRRGPDRREACAAAPDAA